MTTDDRTLPAVLKAQRHLDALAAEVQRFIASNPHIRGTVLRDRLARAVIAGMQDRLRSADKAREAQR